MLLMVTLLIYLHLPSTQGQDPGGSDRTQIFTRPGSDVILSPMYNLTIDKDKGNCDEITWRYEVLRISRNRRCNVIQDNYTEFSNYKTSEDGILTLTNVTRSNSGNYTVTVTKSTTGDRFTHHYNLQVQEPVSNLLLNVSCLPDGGANISCRSDTGTDPMFFITVNGDVLLNSTSSRTVGDVSEVYVPVASPGPWDITCSVRNRISKNETKKTGEKCPVPPSVPVLYGSCLHDGSVEISCSVENGTNPVFSLSENGKLLKNVRKEQKRVNVTLSSSGPWDVHCSVTNNLGTKSNSKTFMACPVPPSVPILKASCHNGSVEISCSVEKGMDPVFSLNVNGALWKKIVTEEKKRINVTLLSSGPWDVHCSVRNKVGEKIITKIFPACEDVQLENSLLWGHLVLHAAVCVLYSLLLLWILCDFRKMKKLLQ